jgi:hypothetical protein
MSDTTNTSGLDARQAQELLEQADRITASVRSGAGWPQIATLLGLGAVSSVSVIALTLAARVPGTPMVLPIVAMMAWILIFSTMGLVFGRTSKRGFGTRWGLYIGAWAVLWTVAMLVGGTYFQGELWFAGVMAALLTVTTTAGAWYEARR